MPAAISRRAAIAFTGLAVAAGAASAQSGATIVRRLEWAGVAVRVGSVEVFIDATSRGAPLTSEAQRRYALATHHHGDHLDARGLVEVLGERGYLVVHEAAARLFDQRILNVQPVRTFEPVFLSRSGGEICAWCVPASDGFGDPQVSWIVDCGNKRIIHCGDTLWHGNWWNTARAYGPFDMAFVPINGARQISQHVRDVGQPMMLGPEQAASAAVALRARAATPIHYGATGDPSYIEEPDALRRFLAAARARELRVRVMAPGEVISL